MYMYTSITHIATDPHTHMYLHTRTHTKALNPSNKAIFRRNHVYVYKHHTRDYIHAYTYIHANTLML